METIKAGMRELPIEGYIDDEEIGIIPVVGITMMSDYKWHLTCLESRLENPEMYCTNLGEDVEAVIAELRKWLAEHDENGNLLTLEEAQSA